jgi:protein-tyrosine phosphatase
MDTTESSVCAALTLGNEIMYSQSILEALNDNRELRINCGDYVFLEFPEDISIYDMKNYVVKILRGGFIPVIAHIEAYRQILKKPNFVWDLREYGAFIHTNASSVAKMRFGKISHFLKYLFSKSYIDVVTESSCKDEKDKNDIEKAKAKITRLFGEDMAVNVTESTPKAIINNERLLRY